jgi:hypothetical protein
MILKSIITATDGKHKYTAIIEDNSKIHKVHFGAIGYQSYPDHKNAERKRLYILRHKTNENWTKSGVLTAGFWSRWVLWNRDTLKESIVDVRRRFNL